MSNTARVDSIDTLKIFRVALIKFGEEANVALASAESEMLRMIGWLERDQASFWQFQIRKRQEGLERAQEALRMKKLFPDASGRFPTPVEEEKAVRKWKAALEEAQEKLANCKKYSRVLQREIMNYKGGVQRFSTWVQAEVPNAVARLDRMVGKLEAYVALSATPASLPVREASISAFGPTEVSTSMARPEPEPVTESEDVSRGAFPEQNDADDNTISGPRA
jgi:hypothetical protein